MRGRTCRGETSNGPVLIFVLEIGAVKAVTAAALIYFAEQHLRRPVPGHLSKFIDGRDEQRGQTAVDLLIDDQHRQTFRRVPATEGAAAQEVTAVDKRTAASLGERFDLDIPASINGRAAPRTVGQLARRADAPDSTAPLVQAAILPARFFALFSRIGSGALPNPETQAEGSCAPRAQLVLPPQNLTGTDECRRTLELLECEQAQCVAHDHGDSLLARAASNCSLQAADCQGVGCQTKIGLCFSSASRKPEQVGHCAGLLAAVGMVQVGQRGQVEQYKSQLEGTPAAILRSIFLLERCVLLSPPLFGIQSMYTLLPHRSIHKGEGLRGVPIVRQESNPLLDANEGTLALLHSLLSHTTVCC